MPTPLPSGPALRRRLKSSGRRRPRALASALVSLGSVAALVAATLVLTAPTADSAAPAAHSHKTFSVLVGHDIAAGSRHHPADYMNFLPRSISVHRGDDLAFTGDFHTATALPVGVRSASAWIGENARRLGQKYFFLAKDDEPGRLIFNPNVLYPSCNVAKGARGCAVDGRHVVTSGGLGLVAPRTVTFAVNVPAGKSFWVICLIHPQMRLRVHVVPRSQAVQTQAQINAAAKRLVGLQTARATALWKRLQHQHSHAGPSGKRVVDAYAGYDARGLELFGMFPRVIRIDHGQRVMWHFDKLLYEPHSVVFPAHLAQVISTGPPPQCEKSSGSGDLPANKDFTCPKGSHPPVEIELDPRLLQGSGSHVVTSKDRVHNSGARGGFDVGSSKPYVLRFPVATKHGFRYACGVHGLMMTGLVAVH